MVSPLFPFPVIAQDLLLFRTQFVLNPFFFSLKKLDDSFVIQVQKFRKSRFSPRSGSLSTGFQGPSTYLILELELLTSATLEGHCWLLHPTGRLLQELRAPSRSPLSYTPPSSPNPPPHLSHFPDTLSSGGCSLNVFWLFGDHSREVLF